MKKVGGYYVFIRFCIVGMLCTGIDVVTFYSILLIASYSLALICGYVFSLSINYFLTIYWTFNTKPSKENAFGVIIAHLFNLFVVRLGLMFTFVDILGLNENVAYLPTLAISVVVNFILIKKMIALFDRDEKKSVNNNSLL